MTYSIRIHPQALEIYESLPWAVRARVFQLLRGSIRIGLISLPVSKIHWHDENTFTLIAPRNYHSHRLYDGIAAHGYVKDEFDWCFYIHKLVYVKPANGMASNRRYMTRIPRIEPCAHIPESDYVNLDEAWLEDQLKISFLDRYASQFDCRKTLPTCIQLEAENCFYADLQQIEIFKRNEGRFLSPSHYDEHMARWHCEHTRFDEKAAENPDAPKIKEFIADFRRSPDTLIMVNFTDESCPYSVAQREFTYLMPIFLKRVFRHLKMHIVDVVIRDTRGNELNSSELEFYYRSNMLGANKTRLAGPARPFSMLLGSLESVTDPWPERADRRLMDFDLYQGCDLEDVNRLESNKAYSQNVRAALHGLFQVTGYASKLASVRLRDFRGLGRWEFAFAMSAMINTVIVLEVLGNDQCEAFEVAANAASHCVLNGYPNIYVTLRDPVESDGETENSVEIPIPYDGSSYIFRDAKNDNPTIWGIIESVQEVYKNLPLMMTDFTMDPAAIMKLMKTSRAK